MLHYRLHRAERRRLVTPLHQWFALVDKSTCPPHSNPSAPLQPLLPSPATRTVASCLPYRCPLLFAVLTPSPPTTPRSILFQKRTRPPILSPPWKCCLTNRRSSPFFFPFYSFSPVYRSLWDFEGIREKFSYGILLSLQRKRIRANLFELIQILFINIEFINILFINNYFFSRLIRNDIGSAICYRGEN